MNLKAPVIALLLIVAAGQTHPAAAQYYDGGHEPATTRWRVISTQRFNILFPEKMETPARQLAVYLDTILPMMQQGYTKPLRRIPIVLHNRKSVSNAFVGWAPSRMELFTVPPPDNYAHDWLEQLSIHESTHWFQFSQMYQGATGVLARIFGEHIAAGVFGIYVPFWVIEGDAVLNETRYSNAGRGRDAGFEQLTRTRLVGEGPYSYDKAYLGSYKDLTANHYELGYQLVAFGKEQYGPHLWDSIYRYVARHPYNPVVFNTALKKYTGLSKTRFYRKAMEDISLKWRISDRFRQSDESVVTMVEGSDWVRYRHPLVCDDGTIIAERTSLRDITSMVRTGSSGKEQVLFCPGYTLESGYSLSGDRIWYAAFARHPRWPNVQYGDLWYYDLQQKRHKQFSSGQRLFSPAADPASREVYAVRYEETHHHTLVRLSPDGNPISEMRLPGGMQATHLSFWREKGCVLFTGIDRQGKAFYAWDGKGEPVRQSPYTWVNIDYPRGSGDNILFQAAFDAVNDIFMYVPEEQSNYRITRSRFGAMHPFADKEGNLYYSEVSPEGMAICRVSPGDFLMERTDWLTHSTGFVHAAKLERRPEEAPSLAGMCDTCYTSRRYRAAMHLFRFHSWAPAAIDPEGATVQPGISIFSQNTLSTAFFQTGYRYDINTLDRELYTSFVYKGYWPQITFEAVYTDAYYRSSDTAIEDFRYGMQRTGLSLALPLSASVKQWNSLLHLETGLNYLGFIHLENTHKNFPSGGLFYTQWKVYIHRLRRMATKDLYPRWGQVADVTLVNTVAGNLDAGSVTGVRLLGYFPGIVRNHGVRLYLGGQHRISGEDLNFNRLISPPRGFPGLKVDDALALSVTYRFPLLYPDVSLGPVIYVKRLTLGLFEDFIIGTHNDETLMKYSHGFELNTDVHLFRHFAPVNLGYGLALPFKSKPYHYFLFGIEFTI